jgi:hypothetical protein
VVLRFRVFGIGFKGLGFLGRGFRVLGFKGSRFLALGFLGFWVSSF